MGHESDKRGGKLILLAILVIFFYLAFFQFNLTAAYDYAVNADSNILQALGF